MSILKSGMYNTLAGKIITITQEDIDSGAVKILPILKKDYQNINNTECLIELNKKEHTIIISHSEKTFMDHFNDLVWSSNTQDIKEIKSLTDKGLSLNQAFDKIIKDRFGIVEH